MINYEKILKKGADVNLKEIDSLNSMEINDLFFYFANHNQDLKNYEGRKEIIYYMDSIGFFTLLVNIREKNKCIHCISAADPDFRLFGRMRLYTSKQDFYGEYEIIFNEFKEIGFSENNAALITSSIGEIIDNAFYHNLGQWNSEFGPLVIFTAQHIPDKKNINISICDFGVGFLNTLIGNYPFLKIEADAIVFALKVNTTGRINKAGGNGLVYLQKNIFNSFAGNIMIRSGNTLTAIEKREEVRIINDNIPFDYGANVYINLNY